MEQIALEADTDVGNLSRIERGVQCPSVDALEQIANALQIRVSVLFMMLEGESPMQMSTEQDIQGLIRNYRSLPDDQKELVIEFVKLLKRKK